MSDILIFGIGIFVTAMVSSSVALLAWAAVTSEDSAHPAAETGNRRLRAIPLENSAQHDGKPWSRSAM